MTIAADALSRCRILVTQTSPNNQTLADLIQHHQGTALCAPLSRIHAKTISQTKQLALREADTFIFLSSHSVRIATTCLQALCDPVTHIAIGPSTQSALERINRPHALVPEYFTRQGICDLPYMQRKGQRVVVFTSTEHQLQKPSLKTMLQNMGHHVVVIYTHSNAFNQQAFQPFPDLPIHAVTVHSAQNLRFLAMHARTWTFLWDLPLIIIKPSLQPLAKHLGFQGEVIQSTSPIASSILAAACSWWQNVDTRSLKTV